MAPAASGGRSQSRGLARPPRQPPAGRCRCFRGRGTRSASRSSAADVSGHAGDHICRRSRATTLGPGNRAQGSSGFSGAVAMAAILLRGPHPRRRAIIRTLSVKPGRKRAVSPLAQKSRRGRHPPGCRPRSGLRLVLRSIPSPGLPFPGPASLSRRRRAERRINRLQSCVVTARLRRRISLPMTAEATPTPAIANVSGSGTASSRTCMALA